MSRAERAGQSRLAKNPRCTLYMRVHVQEGGVNRLRRDPAGLLTHMRRTAQTSAAILGRLRLAGLERLQPYVLRITHITLPWIMALRAST